MALWLQRGDSGVLFPCLSIHARRLSCVSTAGLNSSIYNMLCSDQKLKSLTDGCIIAVPVVISWNGSLLIFEYKAKAHNRRAGL